MAEIGDKIQLKNQEVEVEKCDKCGRKMVNIDADQLASGDLSLLKKEGVSVSNPETEDPVCVSCEFTPSLGHRIAKFFESGSDDDDDSGFFSGGGFLGGASSGGFSGGFGGGFGGFGGGGFSGGGASGSF